jgi:hypothetical protein
VGHGVGQLVTAPAPLLWRDSRPAVCNRVLILRHRPSSARRTGPCGAGRTLRPDYSLGRVRRAVRRRLQHNGRRAQRGGGCALVLPTCCWPGASVVGVAPRGKRRCLRVRMASAHRTGQERSDRCTQTESVGPAQKRRCQRVHNARACTGMSWHPERTAQAATKARALRLA